MRFRRVLRHPSFLAGAMLVLAFALVALAAPLLAPPPEGASPYVIPRDGFALVPQAPSAAHRLGTLEGQSDVLYGVIWGTRIAFRVGLVITAGRALAGVVIGLVSGFYGGLVDGVLMRLTDAFLAFPILAAALVMLATFGRVAESLPSGGQLLMTRRIEIVISGALILFGWMSYARLIRGNVLAEREREYVEAARATGVPARRMLFRHLLPNATRGLFVLMASDVGAMVVLVAAFNFIGLTASARGSLAADWGQMLSLSRNWIIGSPASPFEYWYTFLPPSAAIVLFSVGWHLIGDGFRDLFDPRTR